MKTALKLEMANEVCLSEKILVGKDILELLSGAMYVNPLNLFREYVQNSADSISIPASARILAGASEPPADKILRYLGLKDLPSCLNC